MRLVYALVLIGFASVCLVGCGGCARTEKFDVTVRNDTAGPVTIALTKDGPPFERVWASPEDLAIESPKANEQHGYLMLPPGKVADVSVQGKFDGGTNGYVRVYRGDLQISDMIAIGPSSPNRLDVPLRPGANAIVVGEAKGRLAEMRGTEAPGAEPAPTTVPASR
jgi:hypothetical protein